MLLLLSLKPYPTAEVVNNGDVVDNVKYPAIWILAMARMVMLSFLFLVLVKRRLHKQLSSVIIFKSSFPTLYYWIVILSRILSNVKLSYVGGGS